MKLLSVYLVYRGNTWRGWSRRCGCSAVHLLAVVVGVGPYMLVQLSERFSSLTVVDYSVDVCVRVIIGDKLSLTIHQTRLGSRGGQRLVLLIDSGETFFELARWRFVWCTVHWAAVSVGIHLAVQVLDSSRLLLRGLLLNLFAVVVVDLVLFTERNLPQLGDGLFNGRRFGGGAVGRGESSCVHGLLDVVDGSLAAESGH